MWTFVVGVAASLVLSVLAIIAMDGYDRTVPDRDATSAVHAPRSEGSSPGP